MIKYRLALIIVFLLCFQGVIFAQGVFVQFTRYDQLRWSPDGDQFAFRCLLLDEANPVKIWPNILVKNMNTEQLFCINPTPEQFVISRDQKFLLFSSMYGLYLMKLENPFNTVQLLFRKPAATWYIHHFGFLEKQNVIYLNEFNAISGETNTHCFEIDLPKTLPEWIQPISIKKLEKWIKEDSFNLKMDNAINRNNLFHKVREIEFGFQPKLKTSNQSDYEFIFRDNTNHQRKVLIDDCRPRLLSLNPEREFALVSVFENDSNRTYLFNVNQGNMELIEKFRTYSIAWLGNRQYVCLTDNGLFLRTLDSSEDIKLDDFNILKWCQEIDLSFPKYELQVAFVEDSAEAVEKIRELTKHGIDARMIRYQTKNHSGFRIRAGRFNDKNCAEIEGKRLAAMGYDYWINRIDDLYEHFNQDSPRAEFNFKNKTAQIEYKMDHYLRSRIILKENGESKIIVPEMNNIPDRKDWKLINKNELE